MKYFLIIIMCIYSFSVFSQDTTNVDDDYKTLISDDITIKGFVGSVMTFSSIDNQFAHLMGGGGGLLINDCVIIGGYGLGLTNKFEHGIDTLDEFEFGHGGFWLGGILMDDKTFHPVVSVLIGWGTVSEAKIAGYLNPDKVDKFFVLSPVIEMEMSIAQFLRTSIGINYRYISKLDFYGFNEQQFSSPGLFISIKVGWF